ncbi:MAG TPA: MFS transporter [Solirubrobacteraceae bacterium]|nr:MFS transporter [Solirubrobacteraceae bacterium]
MLRLLRRVALDVTAVRASRDFRLLMGGESVSNLGTQAVMVALPYQIYILSHSATLVGLLGAFELGPMIVVSLVGGALIDRRDRRPVLAVAQIAMIVVTAGLCVTAVGGHPPVILVLALGGILAGCSALDNITRGAIVPGLLGPDHLRSGLAFNYGLSSAMSIVGPGLGGLLIGVFGVSVIYALNGALCLATLAAALAIAPQPPVGVQEHPPVRRAIADGLRFVVSNRPLAGSFLIDINAMTFGMPRALFAVLSLTVYHAGAGGTGLLYAALAAGGTLAVLTSGWLVRARRLGRIVIVVVLVWGAAIVGMGLVRSIAPAAVLLIAAGWADGISAVSRTTISQTLTSDHLRGRMSAVYSLVVTSGPRLGDIESGLVAGLVGALNSVVVGGAVCIVGVGAVVLRFPQLAAYDAEEAMVAVRAEADAVRAEADAGFAAMRPARPPA